MDQAKDTLTNIGKQTGLWRTEKKLPPIEQMARRVKLNALYDFLYATTSELVHFNVRIALRSGWGNAASWKFSPSNLSKYYVMFGRCYGAYVFVKLCSTFSRTLNLSSQFTKTINDLEVWLESQFRWPEIVIFEEMNRPHPGNIILYAVLHMLQEKRVKELKLRQKRRVMKRRVNVSSAAASTST